MPDDAVARLLDAGSDRLAGYGYVLTGSREAGDELVKDAIVALLARPRRRERASEAAVKNRMRELHLAKVRRHRAPEPEPDADPVATGLAKLPPQERAAVVLRHLDRLQIPDIAATMRLSEDRVEGLLAAAHASLARTLGPIDPVLDPVPVVSRRAR
jgi:DNA-directed RNA polymerase specialized sigma24 family protein